MLEYASPADSFHEALLKICSPKLPIPIEWTVEGLVLSLRWPPPGDIYWTGPQLRHSG